MDILVLGDLHFDFYDGKSPVLPRSDVIIVAGDLTNKPTVRWKYAIKYLKEHVAERVMILPGNHDYYDFCIDREDKLREITEENGAEFIQKSSFVLGSKTFHACTLWTDFAHGHPDASIGMLTARREMNDYAYIRHAGKGFRKIDPSMILEIHRDHRNWLHSVVKPGDIVITHHAPVITGNDSISCAYCSDMVKDIIALKPELWLFGHTHRSYDYEIMDTRVANVSFGYPDREKKPNPGNYFLMYF